MRNGSSSAALVLDLTASLVLLDGHDLPIGVQLTYDVADPYALQAHFADPTGEVVTWIFARDLLADGARDSAGEGDVIVWSTPQPGGRTLYLGLVNQSGQAVLRLPHDPVVSFLSRTYADCPRGAEHELLDTDRAIESLLAS
jgi:hypothetical protein